MNAAEAKKYLEANLASTPHRFSWSITEHHYAATTLHLRLLRPDYVAVDGLSRSIPYSGTVSEETLKLVVQSSEELIEELHKLKDAPFSANDLTGVYSSKRAEQNVAPQKLSWWKRVINWLWDA